MTTAISNMDGISNYVDWIHLGSPQMGTCFAAPVATEYFSYLSGYRNGLKWGRAWSCEMGILNKILFGTLPLSQILQAAGKEERVLDFNWTRI